MESFENNQPLTPEQIRSRLSELHSRADELRALAEQHKENIDVELGSEGYIDLGYTAELRDEVEPEIKKLEALLSDQDDVAAAQRDLL